ncbi:MAG: NADH-quinone oxidoreductase subunit [Acidimicrobiaceae bacterium]|nr:NADH-quinone oxidoreductase subunit [Acidimicrobiaceae bacterium]
MARLSAENVQRARDLIALYPMPRSALIPALHVLQEQDGYLTTDGMEHVAELIGITPAEVYGTATFYDMFFTEPVGRHLVSVCTNIACLLNGAYELFEHAEEKLGVRGGATTPDGAFTLEEVECIALCGNAPCLTVNWRFFGDMTNDKFDALADDLRAGRLADEVPPHGTLSRTRREGGLRVGATVGRAAPRATEGATTHVGSPAPDEKRGQDQQPSSQASTQTAAQDAAKVDAPPSNDEGDA